MAFSEPVEYRHKCVRCGNEFISNIRHQYFCMGCREPFAKPALASKLFDDEYNLKPKRPKGLDWMWGVK